MANEAGRLAAAARRSGQSAVLRRIARLCGAAGDAIFALLIVIAGLAALSPLVALAAARETAAVRRRRRLAVAAISRRHGEVWARQARRNATAAAAPVAIWRCPAGEP